MGFIRFKQAFLTILLPYLLAILIQGIGRLYLFWAYAPDSIYGIYTNDIVKMFIVGSRFDIRVASILYAPLLLLAILLASTERLFAFWQRISLFLITFITTLIGALAVMNVYYYMTYERSIDIFIFGLFDDDTNAILITLWQDYPVITSVALFTGVIYVLYRLFKWWQAKCAQFVYRRQPLLLSVLSVLIILAVAFVGIRGSVGTFPLRQSDSQVSEVKLLNMLTPSAGMALDWAYKDYQRNRYFDAATDEEGHRILSQFFAKPTEPSLTAFAVKTPHNVVAERQPPHVVFAIMESLGEHLFTFDSPQRDLFGKLRPHWQQDILFKRFVSEGDGTIDSLTRLLIHSPMSNISQSTAQNVDFSSNMLKPYLANGYKVIFVTSGNGSWRNLNQFLPHLGVTEFVEQNALQHRYPEAEASTWGIADEYMFRYIEERLQDADKKGEHLLILALSTTHHPPYKVPDNYSAPTFSFSDAERARLANLTNAGELSKIFATLRYTTDQLGELIDYVKQSALKTHTIIAITGDHNIRGIGYPDPTEMVLGHAVPFYLYVPDEYKTNISYDPLRVGSHKDIWPTLYALSLSDTNYYQTGCNLLADNLNAAWCFGYNPEVIFDQKGAYSQENFRAWQQNEDGDLLLSSSQPLTAEQRQRSERYWQIAPLLKWQLNRQVHGGK